MHRNSICCIRIVLNGIKRVYKTNWSLVTYLQPFNFFETNTFRGPAVPFGRSTGGGLFIVSPSSPMMIFIKQDGWL